MATIEVDENTMRSLEFAAGVAGTSPGRIVAQLVEAASTGLSERDRLVPNVSTSVAVYVDYRGHRTRGQYDRVTSRVDITSGPLAGKSFKSPTGAARAVVAHYNAEVSPNRNGWYFWVLDDGSGNPLQSIRWL